jgi:hypothetical protein
MLPDLYRPLFIATPKRENATPLRPDTRHAHLSNNRGSLQPTAPAMQCHPCRSMDFKPAHRLRGPAGQRLASCSSGARISRSSNRVSPNAAAESPQQQPASSSLSREAGCSQRHQEDQQQHHQHAVATAAAASAASLLSLLSGAGAALAEEPAYNYPAQDDPVITVMFTVAIGLLSIVTLGVGGRGWGGVVGANVVMR